MAQAIPCDAQNTKPSLPLSPNGPNSNVKTNVSLLCSSPAGVSVGAGLQRSASLKLRVFMKAALAGGTCLLAALVLFWPRPGVRVVSADPRLKILDVQWFAGTNAFDY